MTEEKNYSTNICTLLIEGRLAFDPQESRKVGETEVTTIRIASNTTSKGPIFINVDCWGGRSEFASRLQKGQRVLVQGKLADESYTRASDGAKVERVKIVCDKITALSYPNNNEQPEELKEVRQSNTSKPVPPPPDEGIITSPIDIEETEDTGEPEVEPAEGQELEEVPF